MKKWGLFVVFCLFFLPVSASAEVFKCKYSVDKVNEGEIKPKYVLRDSGVIFKDNKVMLKVFLGNDKGQESGYIESGVFSPSEKNKGEEHSEVDNKVFTKRKDNREFTVFFDDSKELHKWQNCTSDPNEMRFGDYLLAEKVINIVKNSGLQCDAIRSSKELSLSDEQRIMVHKSTLKTVPFIAGSPIECVVKNSFKESNVVDVYQREIGFIDGFRYSMYHSAGSGSIAHEDDRLQEYSNRGWSFSCSRDKFSGNRKCRIQRGLVGIFSNDLDEFRLIIGFDHQPLTSILIKIDENETISGPISGIDSDKAQMVIKQMMAGREAQVRYQSSPRGVNEDSTIILNGFGLAMELVDKLYNNLE